MTLKKLPTLVDGSYLKVVPNFFERAGEMRREYETRVESAQSFTVYKLAWDYWHVDQQFTYFRTLARRFFSPTLFRSFQATLRAWGAHHLGCSEVSELTLAYYLNECEQQLHTDPSNGVFGFSFSLTDWDNRQFTGGETMLLKSEILNFWSEANASVPKLRSDIFYEIPARFNQLTVFDARIPHGVAAVRGVQAPKAARVGLHGWFLPPQMILDSNADWTAAATFVSELEARWLQGIGGGAELSGFVTVRIEFDQVGKVISAHPLAATLQAQNGAADDIRSAAIRHAILVARKARLAGARGPATITAPLIADPR